MYEDRRKSRQIKLVAGAMQLRERYAAITATTDAKLDEMRLVCLSAEAGNRALWLFMKAKGMVSEAERQDWLDKGVNDLLDQINGRQEQPITTFEAGDGKPN